MTIKKTYELQVDYDDGSIRHIERKGKTKADVLHHAQQEFPKPCYVTVTGRKRDPKWRRYYKTYEETPVFPYKGARFADFVYHHKGRPAKGRKAMPRLSYYARPVFAVWTVTHSAPVAKFLKDWVGMIAQDLPIQVPA